jgi:PAS domain S-box-containing protein
MLTADLTRRILDLAPDALVIADATGSIMFANRQITALFGYEPEELIGAPIEILIPERHRARHTGHRQRFVSSPCVRSMCSGLELFARRKDATQITEEISLGPIGEGERTFVVATIRDTTDHLQMQARLRQATREAERANEAKSRFVATASHDLRQPVQTLGFLIGTLRRTGTSGETPKVLDEAERAIATMSRLLNTLLDISKLESGAVKPQLANFRIAHLLEELRADFACIAAAKGLRFEIEACNGVAHSDRALVLQALRNLVANAIKYTQDGRVAIRCAAAGGALKVEVIDTGIGIPANEIARICDDFYQVSVGANVSREGYGLGLSIVSRIVNLLGLGFDIQSTSGHGSTFSLTLPAAVAAAETAPGLPRARESAISLPASKAHILLVEDDPGVRNSTRMLLRVEGHAVSTAANLKEAVQLAAKHADIGMLVSDFHLGSNETGLQVVEAVRDTLGQPVKAILVTGDTSTAMRALTSDSNLRALSKPVNADELLAVVNEMLQPPRV